MKTDGLMVMAAMLGLSLLGKSPVSPAKKQETPYTSVPDDTFVTEAGTEEAVAIAVQTNKGLEAQQNVMLNQLQMTTDDTNSMGGTVSFEAVAGNTWKVTRRGDFTNLLRADNPVRIYKGPVIYCLIRGGNVGPRQAVTSSHTLTVPAWTNIEIYYGGLA